MRNILFINGNSQAFADSLMEGAPDGFSVTCIPASSNDTEKIQALRDVTCTVLFPGILPVEIMREAKSLRLIQLLSAGYDKINVEAAAELGIYVATNGSANAGAVAEHTIALLLAVYKKLIPADASLRAGTWRKSVNVANVFEVAGKTVGIIGAGSIGRKVASRLKAFETEIVYYSRSQVPEMETTLDARRLSLEELLRVSDIITLHTPLLKETRGIIGARELAMMKPHAVLLNTGRGELVDEAALIAALKGGRIAGAGLDVFAPEPPQQGNPLFEFDNVVLTPHFGGHSFEGLRRRTAVAWNNIVKVTAGQKPDFVVGVSAVNLREPRT